MMMVVVVVMMVIATLSIHIQRKLQSVLHMCGVAYVRWHVRGGMCGVACAVLHMCGVAYMRGTQHKQKTRDTPAQTKDPRHTCTLCLSSSTYFC